MTARLEVERIIADWLISDVNTRMAAVPVDADDIAPAPIAAWGDPKFPNTTIAVFDSTRHFWVTERKDPPATPALYVAVQGPIIMAGEPYPSGQIRPTDAPVKVVVRYLTANSDSAAARRDGCYSLRAVARSIRELSKSYNLPNTTMVRNGIALVLENGPMEFWPVIETVGNARVAGALVTHWLARDGQPEY